VSLSSTKLSELCVFAVALLGLPSSDNIILAKNGKRLYQNNNANRNHGEDSISTVGIANGDLIVIMMSGSSNAGTSVVPLPNTNANDSANAGVNDISLGGLDFSSLLGTASINDNANVNTSNRTPASAATKTNSSNGGLTFNLPPGQMSMFNQTIPVQFERMTLDDCIERNSNPSCFIQILLSPAHPNLMKELNYHSPILANKLKAAHKISPQHAANIWREQMQKNAMNSTLSKTLSKKEEDDMTRKLRINPMDEEANAYFGNKIRKQNVDEQYRQMMEEFPEGMGRVLMLYIDAEVNGHKIEAFVDSGAQSTIMSSACAERCGLLHLLDTRFEGTAVGVGTGKILGRIHVAEMKIKGFGHIFPCTITIMDSEKGLGDKNMDFLLGLDMLKRHKCNIVLGRNILQFCVGNEKLETPFLHEKDLSEAKGGTRGFDAEKSNKEIEKRMQDQDNEEDSKAAGGKEDSVMEE